MKKNIKYTFLAVSLMMSSTPSWSATLCNDRMANYGEPNKDGIYEITGKLSNEYCYEILHFQGEAPDIGYDISVTKDSLLSVIGKFYDSTVEDGGMVIISKTILTAGDGYNKDAVATGSNILVQHGGQVRVHDGGTLENSEINGIVYISNNGEMGIDSAGTSKNNTVRNSGQLMVYKGGNDDFKETGSAFNTIVDSAGTLWVYNKGQSYNAKIYDGVEYVQQHGLSTGTDIYRGGVQYVNNYGLSKNVKIHEGGKQVISSNSKAENTDINSGKQEVYSTSVSENTTMTGDSTSWLFVGSQALGKTDIYQNSKLNLTTGESNRGGEYSGAYAENVILNNADSTVIVNKGKHGDSAVIGDLSGQGKVIFQTDEQSGYANLNINNLSGSQSFYMNTSISNLRGDYITINNGNGSHILNIKDSGVEITRPDQSRLDLITDKSSNAQFSLSALDGTNINAVDGGTYMYSLYQRDEQDGKIWYLAAQKDDNTGEPGEPEKPVPPVVPDYKTTPSTDAVLSMAAAPQLIFNHELDNLRFRRGELRDNQGDAGVWVRLTGDRTRAGTGHTHFKLNQAGFELGADKSVPLENGKLWLGVFTGYNDVKLKHQRGGESSIDSVTAGGYATWFSDNGWYLDGVLKYNHFNNELRAVSTNRSSIRGDYSQNAYGASAEAGYSFDLPEAFWAEPYARLSYMRADSKSVHLNNNMQAKLDAQQSLQSELGLHAGKDFTLNNQVIITPYATLAWQHEFINNNDVTINQRNTFDTDFSGDSLKAGGGLTVRFTPQIQAYAEIDYRKGDKTESPLHGNIGVRYNF
ncbi:autotransporter outer membrane beta-barrel domain-containing protein [Proteus mirabilis]|uniref:autotransporter outer membrane beta-barrel domain-containing protein n=1 Tax=Proteus mirabilis TaxID=584 RepID=UPI0038AC3EBA